MKDAAKESPASQAQPSQIDQFAERQSASAECGNGGEQQNESDDLSWKTLLTDVRKGASTWMTLVQTEAQLLVDTLARLHALSLSMAAVGVTGWVALLATLGAIGWKQGIPLEWLFGAIALLSLIAVTVMYRWQKRLVRQIGFPASVRQLGLMAASHAEPDAEANTGAQKNSAASQTGQQQELKEAA